MLAASSGGSSDPGAPGGTDPPPVRVGQPPGGDGASRSAQRQCPGAGVHSGAPGPAAAGPPVTAAAVWEGACGPAIRGSHPRAGRLPRTPSAPAPAGTRAVGRRANVPRRPGKDALGRPAVGVSPGPRWPTRGGRRWVAVAARTAREKRPNGPLPSAARRRRLATPGTSGRGSRQRKDAPDRKRARQGRGPDRSGGPGVPRRLVEESHVARMGKARREGQGARSRVGSARGRAPGAVEGVVRGERGQCACLPARSRAASTRGSRFG